MKKSLQFIIASKLKSINPISFTVFRQMKIQFPIFYLVCCNSILKAKFERKGELIHLFNASISNQASLPPYKSLSQRKQFPISCCNCILKTDFKKNNSCAIDYVQTSSISLLSFFKKSNFRFSTVCIFATTS